MMLPEYAIALGLMLTEDQVVAARYLESIGQRFLIDFGYQNVVPKAKAEIEARIPKHLM